MKPEIKMRLIGKVWDSSHFGRFFEPLLTCHTIAPLIDRRSHPSAPTLDQGALLPRNDSNPENASY
jgi:hypothetical protein